MTINNDGVFRLLSSGDRVIWLIKLICYIFNGITFLIVINSLMS